MLIWAGMAAVAGFDPARLFSSGWWCVQSLAHFIVHSMGEKNDVVCLSVLEVGRRYAGTGVAGL